MYCAIFYLETETYLCPLKLRHMYVVLYIQRVGLGLKYSHLGFCIFFFNTSTMQGALV
jgi:hypothetical protein